MMFFFLEHPTRPSHDFQEQVPIKYWIPSVVWQLNSCARHAINSHHECSQAGDDRPPHEGAQPGRQRYLS